MEENSMERHVINNFAEGSNCQVFNGDITGCVFAMPGSSVVQHGAKNTNDNDNEVEFKGSKVQEFKEELFHFVHPEIDDEEAWQIHNSVKRLVTRQSVQEICNHLLQMKKDGKLLLPVSPSTAYKELVRIGMPDGVGYNESTFRKYYSNK